MGLLAGVAAASPAAAMTVGKGRFIASITRDGYGVPHIHSATLSGMWFGAGYAQAQDRLVQLELVRRNSEGTLAQVFGPAGAIDRRGQPPAVLHDARDAGPAARDAEVGAGSPQRTTRRA